MARRRGKTVDKWKQKIKYKILAPEDYDYRELGTTVSSDPKNLTGRTIGVSMRDITGDKAKQYQNLVFELTKPEGKTVHTKFKKYIVAGRYLSSHVKEGTSKIESVEDVDISGTKIRAKVVIITKGYIKATQKKEIMKRILRVLNRHEKDTPHGFVQSVITSKLGTEMYQNIKNISPIRRVEISEISAI